MKIERGIVANCSETVYRLSKTDWDKNKEVLIPVLHGEFGNRRGFIGSLIPVEGYSQLRPAKDEICVYYYQTFGGSFMDKLEELEIPYDTQQWLTYFDFDSPDYDKIRIHKIPLEDGATVKDLEFPVTIFRRKPYK